MTRGELKELYFEWRCGIVGVDHNGRSYLALYRHLDSIPFRYTFPLDGNREADGIDFRYRFGYEHGYDGRMVASYLDDCPCSVFEMMTALAFRCEEQIMCNAEYGDRTGEWFWAMIESLGLSGMDDGNFEASFVESIIDRFLDRKFERNGEGGLFTVRNPRKDMRSTEIWYQMCFYLNDISEAS